MTRRPRSVDLLRPAGRRFAAGLFLVAAPKCLLCLAAYAGLDTALGLGGQELCGAPAEGAGSALGPADLAAVVTLLISAGFLQCTRHTAPASCR